MGEVRVRRVEHHSAIHGTSKNSHREAFRRSGIKWPNLSDAPPELTVYSLFSLLSLAKA